MSNTLEAEMVTHDLTVELFRLDEQLPTDQQPAAAYLSAWPLSDQLHAF